MVKINKPKKTVDDEYMMLRYAMSYNMIRDYLLSKRSLDILDVGGYDCRIYDYIKKNKHLNVTYHLVDFDNSIFPIVKKKGITAQFANLNYTPVHTLLKKKYDVIICTEFLEHIIDPNMQLESFKRLLKPKGILLISMPNECTIFHRIYMFLGMGIDQLVFTIGKHLQFPTIAQTTALISNHFKIIKKKYYVNMSGTNSRFGFIGNVLNFFSPAFWQFFGNMRPTLFARGTIFLCQKK